MARTEFASLRAEIRSIVDAAGRHLLSGEIFANVKRRCTLATFGVTLAQMVNDEQLVKVPVTRVRANGTRSRFAYRGGPKPVSERKEYRPERQKLKGFMALAREREAKQRGAA